MSAQDASRRKCPVCGKPAADAFKPFCSARCADVDLNRWLGGVYRIPTDEAPAGVSGGELARPFDPANDDTPRDKG